MAEKERGMRRIGALVIAVAFALIFAEGALRLIGFEPLEKSRRAEPTDGMLRLHTSIGRHSTRKRLSR